MGGPSILIPTTISLLFLLLFGIPLSKPEKENEFKNKG